MPSCKELTAETQARLQTMREVDSWLRALPSLMLSSAFGPEELQSTSSADHPIDPWLRAPLELVPETGIPRGHLGIYLKKGMLNRIQSEKKYSRQARLVFR